MRRNRRCEGLRGWLATGLILATATAARAEDSWDAVYLAGAKIGSVHTFVEPVKDGPRQLLRVRIDSSLSFKRLNDRVTMKFQYGTIETPEGQVLSLDTRTLASDAEIRVYGKVVDGKMNLIVEGTGQRQEQTIDWGPDVRGPHAAEQSLSRHPMKPGEVRPIKMFMPELNKVCDLTLTAKAVEEVPLGGGTKRPLLRVEQATALEGKPRPEFDVTLWVDTGGQVLKSSTDNFGGMVQYRTTRDGALAAPTDAGARYDQILNTVVKVRRKIPRPETTRDVSYLVTLKGESPADVIPADRRQALRPGSKANEAVLVVKTAGPNVGVPEPAPDDAFLRPNAMITCQDDRVVGLARKAVGDATDPWEKAKRVEHYVAKNLHDKNFAVAFAPASEVAKNLSGDCTEHGVLTAAMCRAEGVPARVAIGLVYVDSLGGFGFHLWNEVYVNRRWVAIDSTFEQDDVDAVHIKLGDSSLDGVSPFESLLPIVRVLGKLSIDATEVR